MKGTEITCFTYGFYFK